MKRICVFCGSSSASEPVFLETAKRLGAMLAHRKIALVYGGGCHGLMGAVANAAFEEGGKVIGVISKSLIAKEGRNDRLSELRIVEMIAERKELMISLSDGFVALPGGYGTINELYEVLVAIQLGHIAKPCAVLNLDGFFNPLLEQIRHSSTKGFIPAAQQEILLVESDVERLLDRMVVEMV